MIEDDLYSITAQLDHLSNKLNNLIKRGYVSLTNDDSKKVSYAQVTYLGKTNYAEMLFPYGMSAMPPLNTIALVMNVCGCPENIVCFPYSQLSRKKDLKEGEVAYGNPQAGTYIHFKNNGEIEIKGNVVIQDKLTINGDLVLNGKATLGGSGAAIARVGDEVKVGTETGAITTGSTNNTSN